MAYLVNRTLRSDFVDKCNSFAENRLHVKQLILNNFGLVIEKNLLILSGFLNIVKRELKKQILSYQQVIHNAKMFMVSYLPMAPGPNIMPKKDLGIAWDCISVCEYRL